jgi:hypothetical protein
LSENRVVDLQEQLEMTMLDREMADEKRELAESESEELRDKLEEMKVEMSVLKSEAGGGAADEGSVDAPEKSSLAYKQLERQNERLKEALIKCALSLSSILFLTTPVGSAIYLMKPNTNNASASKKWKKTLKLSTNSKVCPLTHLIPHHNF